MDQRPFLTGFHKWRSVTVRGLPFPERPLAMGFRPKPRPACDAPAGTEPGGPASPPAEEGAAATKTPLRAPPT